MSQNDLLVPYLLCGDTKIYLNGPKFTIGRSIDNSYVLEDGRISRIHCIFEEINGNWHLIDKSSNGLLYNKKKIPSNTSQTLTNGDTINLLNIFEYVFVSKIKNNLNMSNPVPSTSFGSTTTWNISEHTYNLRSNTADKNTDICSNVTQTANENVTNSSNKRTYCCNCHCESYNGQPETKRKKVQENCNISEHMEQDLQCSICTELFIDPTILNCAHSFCKYCIKEWQRKSECCPICRTTITTSVPVTEWDDIIAKIMDSKPNYIKEQREESIKDRENQPESVIYPATLDDETHSSYTDSEDSQDSVESQSDDEAHTSDSDAANDDIFSSDEGSEEDEVDLFTFLLLMYRSRR